MRGRDLSHLAALLLLLFSGCSGDGAASPDTAEAKRAFLGEPAATILLFGTFHFKDSGLDGYKPQFDIDILSAQRQREVAEVVDRLASYRPTKIAVEWLPEQWLVSTTRVRPGESGGKRPRHPGASCPDPPRCGRWRSRRSRGGPRHLPA